MYVYIVLICTNYIYFKIGFFCVSFLPDLPFYLFIFWKTSLPKYLVCSLSFFNFLKKRHLEASHSLCSILLAIFYGAKAVLKLGCFLLLSL